MHTHKVKGIGGAIFIATVLIAGCATQPPPPGMNACSEPRPQVCTMIYAPVCGVSADGDQTTYGNACGACADPKIIGSTAGECVVK